MLAEPSVAGSRPGISHEQKIGFTLLLIFAILSIGLGVLQIRNTMYAPFALNNKVSLAIKDQVNSIDALRYRDTDHDGLSDFEELYIYGTSPYLYDTFSYGISDKEVVAKGLPLCPKGQECGSPVVSGDSTPTTSSKSVPFAPPSDAGLPPDLLQTFNDPKQVRELLIKAGTDKKVLDKVSDADLAIMIKQILSNSSTMKSLESINALVSTTKKIGQ